jgi:hypothetical protein
MISRGNRSCTYLSLFFSTWLLLLNITLYSQSFTKENIELNFNETRNVFAIDMDGDGDIDVLGVARLADEIAWFENDGDENFTKHTIKNNFDGAFGVFAIDVDGDNDIDVIGAADAADDITWFENDGNENFTEHVIKGNFDGAKDVYGIDLDEDGDIDIIATAANADDITWFENDGSENFTEHTIKGNYDGSKSVFPIDLDGDNDIDILGTASGADDITWFENDGSENFTEHTIKGNFDGAFGVFAADIDGDNDIDVLGTATTAEDIIWWENDGNENFTEHLIDGNFDGARDAYAVDLNEDGNIDILSVATDIDDVTWWENDGSENFTERIIDGSFDGAFGVFPIDIDGDSDVDVVAGATNADDVVWYKSDLAIAAAFMVTNVNDMGAGSLRQAILDANAQEGVDKIQFNIAGAGDQTIALQSALPIISEDVVIDGTSQPGFSGDPIIVLDGTGQGTGNILALEGVGNRTIIKGLIINNSPKNGILIKSSAGVRVDTCFIGTNATATTAQANQENGILIFSSDNCTINKVLLSGNTENGISIVGTSDNNKIKACLIGLNKTGSDTIPNIMHGIELDGDGNTLIGGDAVNDRNIISGNRMNGIAVTSNNNSVKNNFIGTDINGNTSLGNVAHGIFIGSSKSGNLIGTTTAGNLISGNNKNGIEVDFTNTVNPTKIQNNIIGLNAGGTTALPNKEAGIALLDRAVDVLVGGTNANEKNIISGNTGMGMILKGRELKIQGNFIGTNAAGNASIGNGSGGVELSVKQVFSNHIITVGDTLAGAGNIIAGNGGLAGIIAPETFGKDVQILGNFIGTDAAGTQDLGNMGAGILFLGANGVKVGGAIGGSANKIAFNGTNGIEIGADTAANESQNILISQNSIYDNTQKGIAYRNDQTAVATAVLSSAIAGVNFLITGTLTGKPNTTYTIEAFKNTAANGAGNHEGKTFFSTFDITTDGNGDGVINESSNAMVNIGEFVTLTAVEANENTSEFSNGVAAAGQTVDVEVVSIAPVSNGPCFGNTEMIEVVILNNGLNDIAIGTVSIALTGAENNPPNQNNTLLLATGAMETLTFNNVDLSTENQLYMLKAEATLAGDVVANNNVTMHNILNDCVATGIAITNTNDAGNGSLRAAILAANANAGADTLRFVIPDTGLQTINLQTALPLINEDIVIDGTTQPSFMEQPIIEINGMSQGTGSILSFDGLANVKVKSLIINGAPTHGISLLNCSGGQIDNCFIGTNANGTMAKANTEHGVLLTNSNNISIQNSVLSGNGENGILITGTATGNTIKACKVGTDKTGTMAIQNNDSGIRIESDANTVGGNLVTDRNIISGNKINGIAISANGDNNIIRNNYIGTDTSGLAALGNLMEGISVFGKNNSVGSSTAGNLIAGNKQNGIIIGSGGMNNSIQNNKIGLDKTGLTALPNEASGIEIKTGSESTQIGGFNANEGNIIAGNGARGIMIFGNSNRVEGNKIGTNQTGTAAIPNSDGGIRILNSSSNKIGTPVVGGGNLISGNGFSGIIMEGTAINNLVQNNIIGLDMTGMTAIGNSFGVSLIGTSIGSSSSTNTIGGTGQLEGNTISGNKASGVFISAIGRVISGNKIGTDITGMQDVGNEEVGIFIIKGNGLIGGESNLIEQNLISGNDFQGILINPNTKENIIKGNKIGTDITGTQDLGNTRDGIKLVTSKLNIIGSPALGEGNLISGNDDNGILILNAGSDDNKIQNNIIGLNAAGTDTLGNTDFGISISASPKRTQIGGKNANEGNIISGNQRSGIVISGDMHKIEGNKIGTDKDGNTDLGNSRNGIFISGEQNVIDSNLVSGNDLDGIEIDEDAINNKIIRNLIGTNHAGTAAIANGENGILVDGDTTQIGGNIAGEGNLIAGNGARGIEVNGNKATIQGNIIGLNKAGTAAIANQSHGISLFSEATLIGGRTATARNIISGNLGNGIEMQDVFEVNVEGNFIGTNAAGNQSIGNAEAGINLPNSLFGNNAFFNIGDTLAGAGNVISGNKFGIKAQFSIATDSKIAGNFIGTDLNGTQDLGNKKDGILLLATNDLIIGGLPTEAFNTIAFNDSAGISIVNDTISSTGLESSNILIAQNAIFDNGTKGIAHSAGQTAVAIPVLNSATLNTDLAISGNLMGKANTLYTLLFYKNNATNDAGRHEGKVFIGKATVNTNGNGEGTISANFNSNAIAGDFITATAVEENQNTSEFSQGIIINSNVDNCPNDPNKLDPGQCGCGVADTDTDMDGTADCNDNCPNDPNKVNPGDCGCGEAETDTDMDGTADCSDNCPNDPNKTEPGQCGCGEVETDTDMDGTADCNDNCPNDPNKTNPGDCGCGTAETDTDMDGTPDCNDNCPNDPNKINPGDCGCGTADTDTDMDGTADCNDACPNDPNNDCACSDADLTIDERPIPSKIFATAQKITSTGLVEKDSTVQFKAAVSITLNAGFQAQAGSSFTAKIEACSSNLSSETETLATRNQIDKDEKLLFSSKNDAFFKMPSIKAYPNPTSSFTTFEINLSTATVVQLELKDLNGRNIVTLINQQSFSKGIHLMHWSAHEIAAGMYLLVMNGRNVGKLVVLK